MYGTVARLRAKPGMEGQLQHLMNQYEAQPPAGYRTTYVYRMDDDPYTYYLAVIFTDKSTYVANAQSPEQDARYQEMLALLEGPPEWHDGEIISPQS